MKVTTEDLRNAGIEEATIRELTRWNGRVNTNVQTKMGRRIDGGMFPLAIIDIDLIREKIKESLPGLRHDYKKSREKWLKKFDEVVKKLKGEDSE